MFKKELSLTTGESIEIYRNILPADICYRLYHEARSNIHYKWGVSASKSSSDRWDGRNFSRTLSDQEDEIFGINRQNFIRDITKNMIRLRSWINATIKGSWIYSHVDMDENRQGKTLIYNINNFWEAEHGGEMMFANKFGEKEIAVDYVPGQVILFPSHLPHTVAFSDGHFEPRFVYVCQYIPEKD